jgi:hypothetical protein
MKPVIIIAIAVVFSVVAVFVISQVSWHIANEEFEKSMNEFIVEQELAEQDRIVMEQVMNTPILPKTEAEAKVMLEQLEKQLKEQCTITHGLDIIEYEECLNPLPESKYDLMTLDEISSDYQDCKYDASRTSMTCDNMLNEMLAVYCESNHEDFAKRNLCLNVESNNIKEN